MSAEKMRTIFAAGFVTESGTGGFEWSADRDTVAGIRKQWVADGGADISQVRELEVVANLSPELVTSWLDERADLWEPKEGERPSRLEQVMASTDCLDHFEIIQQVVTVILDREEDDVIDVDRMVKFLGDDGADMLYMDVIAPAIDQCERKIREATPNEEGDK